MAILEAKNVKKSFDGFRALKGIDFSVEKGDRVAVIGPSGSGKSTFLRCLNYLEKVDGGEIIIDGTRIVSEVKGKAVYIKEEEVRRATAKLGMVFQNFNLFPHLSVLENITIAPRCVLKREKAECEEQARELVRLAKYAPLGERGVSMTRPHTGFCKLDAAAYMEEANRETVIVCQMESPLGVKNLDAILSVKGVDGVLIGPNDMTQSMGILNQLDHPEYLALVEQVMETCSRHNKFSGISGKNLPALREYAKKGMRLLQWGTDISLLMDAIRSGLQK